MGSLRYISLTVLLTAAATAVAAEPADSVATDSIAAIEKAMSKKLDEVTVEGKTHWHDVNGSTYLPTKKQKNAASDANDLLARMAIPEINATVGSSSVTTKGGQPVSLFINYLPADQAELKGMNVKDCERVEYLESPTDPRFQGATYVINFIMQEYEYGGYTKLNTSQIFLNCYQNSETLFSRFTYRKMTYDISAQTWNHKNNHAGTSQYTVMKLTDDKGEEYLLHRDEIYDKSRGRSDYFPLQFRATYRSDKVLFRNTLSYEFTNYLAQEKSGRLVYNPSSDKDYSYSTNNPSRDNTLGYSGYLFIALPRDFSLTFTPSFAYTHTNSYSIYSRSGIDIVNRHAREDAYNVRGKLRVQKPFGTKHILSLSVDGGDNINRLKYIGTDNFDDKYSSGLAVGEIGYKFQSSNFFADFDGGFAWEGSSINGFKNNDYYPYAHLNSRWSINDKNNLSLWFQYATNSPGITALASDVLSVNEFIYKTGNPDLKNSRHITLDLSYFRSFSDNIYLSANGSFYELLKRPAEEYLPYNGGRQLIRRVINSGNFYQGNINAELNVFLFNKKVLLRCAPALSFYKTTGINAKDLTTPSLLFSAQYYFGDFALFGYVISPKKTFESGNGAIYTPRWFYSLILTWGHNDWKVLLRATDFFNYGYRAGTSVMNSPYYSYTNEIYNAFKAHAGVSIEITYTFGYGKKVSRGDEKLESERAASAIM